MRLVRFIEIFEWLPILLVPFVVYFLTDGFTQKLSVEVWLILGFATLVNVGWLALVRWQRRLLEFAEKYPGFRVKR